MKPAKPRSKPVHPADERRISFHGLSAKTVLAAMLKVKPEPKKKSRKTERKHGNP